MSTGIQWTDETWNPVVGCTKVSQGCKNCYAKTLHDQRHKAFLAGKKVAPQYAHPFEHVQFIPARLYDPLSWRKPRRVFVNSVSDVFHEDLRDDEIARVFATMAAAHQHTFQVLTKRPQRMKELVSSEEFRENVHPFLDELIAERIDPNDRRKDDLRATAPAILDEGWPLANVWLGVSVENQEAADERIPLLLDTPAVVRFLSCEPLLGPVKLSQDWKDYLAGWNCREQHHPDCDGAFSCSSDCPVAEQYETERVAWVIVGGESGRKARPFDLAWARDLLAQCHNAGVPCFIKQLGSSPVDPWADTGALITDRTPHVPKFRDSHGGDPAEWPEELRVREFPAVAA